MVQRVPGHIGEESRFSPWLVVGAVVVIIIVGALLLFFSGFPGTGLASSGSQFTRTPHATTTTTTIIITATPEATMVPTAAPTAIVVKYTVKRGDTLTSISQKYSVPIAAIRAANGLRDDTIKVGDVLIIPVPTPTPPALSQVRRPTATETPIVFRTPTLIAFALTSTPRSPTTPTATPGVVVYAVKSGDTLSGIAAVFSTTVQSIMDLSHLDGPNLRVGQILTVPLGVVTLTPTATIHFEPTLTVTPQFAYAAPDLTYPADSADIAHSSSITFQWLSPGALRADEYYLVHLRYTVNGVEHNLVSPPIHEGTAWSVDKSPVGNAGPTPFFWYVVIVRGSGCGSTSAAVAQPCAVSPISETRGFTWR
jgi:LysM repeat protein